MIDTHAFTPLASATGGVLIGIAVALLLLLNGRIAGISGIATGIITAVSGERVWRAAFLGGLLLAPSIYIVVVGAPQIDLQASSGRIAIAGLLTGIGTGLANGCTSGHGVCGVARFSRRSLVATSVFMITAIAVVFVLRHVLKV